MQRTLTCLSRFLLLCSFLRHPIISCFVSRSIRVSVPRQEYLIGARGSICSVLLNGHRNTREAERSAERPRNNGSKNNAIALNKKITYFGKEGKWKEILQLAKKEKNRLNNVNWATAFSQLGRIRKLDRRDPLFKSFVKEYAAYLERRGLQWAGVREVANVVHAIGKMGLKNPETKSILAFVSEKENTREIVRDGMPQAVANIAWSFARLGVRSPELFAAIETRADWLVTNGKPQEVANTVWAFATLGIKSQKLFAAIETHEDCLVTNGTPQNVANTAWAFATLDVRSPKLFTEIETRADWLVTNGTPQAVANTAWAFATLNMKSPKLFGAIEARADWLVKSGKPQAVANTIWAASHFQYYAPKLMEEANLRGTWLVEDGNIQEISNLSIAFANYGYDAVTFFKAVANNVSKLINDRNPQHVLNVCYAMAILDLGKKHSDAFGQLWKTAINLDATMLRNEGLSQLGQVLALCTANEMKLTQPSASLTKKIGAVVVDSNQSKYQQEVGTTLGQLDLDYEEVFSLEEGSHINNSMLSINFACKNQMVAIEYDGESHFLRELGTGKVTKRENGATKAKRRFLRQTGWNVINIGYQDWIAAKKKNCRLEFLRKKLRQGRMQL